MAPQLALSVVNQIILILLFLVYIKLVRLYLKPMMMIEILLDKLDEKQLLLLQHRLLEELRQDHENGPWFSIANKVVASGLHRPKNFGVAGLRGGKYGNPGSLEDGVPGTFNDLICRQSVSNLKRILGSDSARFDRDAAWCKRQGIRGAIQ